jgi:hypothetical protein
MRRLLAHGGGRTDDSDEYLQREIPRNFAAIYLARGQVLAWLEVACVAYLCGRLRV